MKRLLFSLLIISTLPASSQKIGGHVKVLEEGQWKNAKLLSIKRNQYFVHFDDRPDFYDKLVNENEIAFIDGDDRIPLHDTI
jgi:hypothetical protein